MFLWEYFGRIDRMCLIVFLRVFKCGHFGLVKKKLLSRLDLSGLVCEVIFLRFGWVVMVWEVLYSKENCASQSIYYMTDRVIFYRLEEMCYLLE